MPEITPQAPQEKTSRSAARQPVRMLIGFIVFGAIYYYVCLTTSLTSLTIKMREWDGEGAATWEQARSAQATLATGNAVGFPFLFLAGKLTGVGGDALKMWDAPIWFAGFFLNTAMWYLLALAALRAFARWRRRAQSEGS